MHGKRGFFQLLALFIALLLLWGSFAMIQDKLLYFPDNPPRSALLADAARAILLLPPGTSWKTSAANTIHGYRSVGCCVTV